MRPLPLLLIAAVLLTGCTELTELRERTTLQQREIERLRSERNQWRDDYYEVHERHQELTQRYETDMAELREENNRLRTSLSEREQFLESEVERLTAELRQAETRIATLEGEREQLLTTLNDTQADLAEKTSTADALQATLDALRSDLQAAEQDITQYDSQLEQALSGSDELRASLQALREERDAFRDEVERLRSENDTLRGEVGSASFSETQMDRISSYVGDQFTDEAGPTPTITEDPQRGVVITFQGGDLFESGSTVLTDDAERAVTIVGLALAQLPETRLEVIGHTDNEPINTMAFRDNWQLSASRAENVMRVLIDEGGVDPSRVIYAAAGQHQPVESNDTLEGRRVNRRVEIVVTPHRGS